MTLVTQVENILAEQGKTASKHSPETASPKEREALRRAEELADQFSDIKPKLDFPSPERYFGLPPYAK